MELNRKRMKMELNCDTLQPRALGCEYAGLNAFNGNTFDTIHSNAIQELVEYLTSFH